MLQHVSDATVNFGMFAVTGVDMAHQALTSFVSCALRDDLNLRQVTLDDGARRRTLATSTVRGVPAALPAGPSRDCPDFSSAAAQLRAAVSATGSAYAGILDQLLYSNDDGEGAAAAGTSSAAPSSYKDAVHSAESLEHFHLFEPSESPSANAMLAMHSDIGLFLVMTPAELFSRHAATTTAEQHHQGGSSSTAMGAHYAHDLVVQLPDGRIVTPVLPDGALLVMNGEGLTRWMRQPSPGRVQPYSPMHAVLSSDLSGGVRAWFGRMFMPPDHARLQVADVGDLGDHTITNASGDEKMQHARAGVVRRSLRISTPAATTLSGLQQHPLPITFVEYRQRTYSLFHGGRGQEAPTVGCSPARRQLVDESSCGADQVFCWMSCMAIPPNSTCGKSDLICANTKNTSQLWPRDFLIPSTNNPTHCATCAPMCPNTPAPNSTSSASSFCNTNLGTTTMWMTGFQFAAGHHSGPCVVFLFPEWVLDTRGKFAGACIGTYFMGVAVGALGWARNELKDAWVAEGRWDLGYPSWWRTWLADATIIAIIAVQVCLGYWLMLIGMTYQAELFLMVVLGLAFGHLFFRPKPRRSKDGMAGCCESSADGCAQPPHEKLEPCCAT